jgi:hypothetical protein
MFRLDRNDDDEENRQRLEEIEREPPFLIRGKNGENG